MKHEIKGCPWCGTPPTPASKKVHNCGEPYIVVSINCKHCGVGMSAVASDKECDAAQDMNQERYRKNEPLLHYQLLVEHVVIKERLLSRWNTRHG